MISNTFQTNTFTGGMDLDTDISMIHNNSYREANNIRVITDTNGTTAVIQGLESSKQYDVTGQMIGHPVASTTIKDIGVIITCQTDNEGNCYHYIYKLEGFDTDTITVTKVLSGNLGMTDKPMSLVGNCESDNIYKIYFTTGETHICISDLGDERFLDGTEYVDENGHILDPNLISIFPTSSLSAPMYVNVTSGSLGAGMVSYCYQLFNVNGISTAASPVSNLVHLAYDDTTAGSAYYTGNTSTETVNRGVIMRVDNIPQGFDMIRIIRLFYAENNAIPTISIVEEQRIDSDSFKFTDTGSSISEITIEELNAYGLYQFKAEVLAKKDNRLFAANITEDTWDAGEFDARAYRVNANSMTVLQSSISANSIQIDNINTYDLTSIPYDHDCINPFNEVGFSQLFIDNNYDGMYMYGPYRTNNEGVNSRVLGGYGINIEYTFVTTRAEMYEVDTIDTHLNKPNFDMNRSGFKTREEIFGFPVQLTQPVFEIGSDQSWNEDYDGDDRVILRNYASPYFANRYTGYRRDELYRFGIVFFNERGNRSQVFWIGDIRMPTISQAPLITTIGNVLYCNSLGIRFVVKNMPEDAVSYQIVRCDKTENDRNIICQVVSDRLYPYYITDTDLIGEGDTLTNTLEMRPLPFFHADSTRFIHIHGQNSHFNVDYNANDLGEPQSGFCRIVSPEICLNGDQVADAIRGAYILGLGQYYSLVDPESTGHRNFGYASHVDKVNTYPVNGQRVFTEQIEASGYTVNRFEFAIGGSSSSSNNSRCSAYVSKYNYFQSINYASESPDNLYQRIEDVVNPPTVDWNVFNGGAIHSYTTNIGDHTYTNYAMSSFRGAFRTGNNFTSQPILGPAGPCLVLQTDGGPINAINYNTDDKVSILDSSNSVTLNNITLNRYTSAYGGNTYFNRANSTYIATGNRLFEEGDIVFGGDTYVGIFDYINCSVFQANDAAFAEDSKHGMFSYIPMESDINMNLLSGYMVHNTYQPNTTGGNVGAVQGYIQLQPVQMGNYYAQSKPYYEYNDAYSAQNTGMTYTPVSQYAVSDLHIPNRILASQAKTNGEVIDSWAAFKAADYLDVDSSFGEITNLYTFRDRLFFWQDNALGIASVNERSLITDDGGSQLILGTGGILARYDYITNNNGTSIVNNPTITNSDMALFWYDDNKNELLTYADGLSILSKTKQVQTYFNQNKQYAINPLLMDAFYDKKYNEVWFKIFNKNLIYNEQLNRFTSFYDHLDNTDSLTFYDKIIVINNSDSGNVGQLYEINRNDMQDDQLDKDADITLIVNKDYQYTKTFDNIRTYIEGNDPITQIDFVTQNNKQTATVTQPTLDYREDTYRMAIPRQDNFKDNQMSFPARLRSKALTETFYMTPDFKIPYITTTYRYSLI